MKNKNVSLIKKNIKGSNEELRISFLGHFSFIEHYLHSRY